MLVLDMARMSRYVKGAVCSMAIRPVADTTLLFESQSIEELTEELLTQAPRDTRVEHHRDCAVAVGEHQAGLTLEVLWVGQGRPLQ